MCIDDRLVVRAQRLLNCFTLASRKIDAIRRSGAQIVATGNPGCLMQIKNGVQAAGLDVKVVHPVELLADAYRASTGD